MPIHMAAAVVADVIVVVHDEHAPGDDEWQAWLGLYRKHASDSRALVVRREAVRGHHSARTFSTPSTR
jgi:hypothetical protein